MLTKCRAIVIRTVNYSESSVILKCYTDLHGIQSYMVNGVRSRKGSIRPSQLQPLTLLELEAYQQQNKNLQRIRELKCMPPLRQLHFDIIKGAIGMFVSEVLYKAIREEAHADETLFSFLFHAIQLLDLSHDKTANFPVYFMLQLSRYLGFYPKGSYTAETDGFDLHEGSFDRYDLRNPFQVEPALSEKMSLLLRCGFDSMHDVPFSHAQRSTLLAHLVSYYSEHLDDFSELRSHKVLNEVLA